MGQSISRDSTGSSGLEETLPRHKTAHKYRFLHFSRSASLSQRKFSPSFNHLGGSRCKIPWQQAGGRKQCFLGGILSTSSCKTSAEKNLKKPAAVLRAKHGGDVNRKTINQDGSMDHHGSQRKESQHESGSKTNSR